MFKRSRDPQDAQTKRSDYEQSLNTNQDFSGVWQSNDYKRASKETMAKRKVVSVKRIDKRHQFVKHAKSLNKTFFDWFSNQINKDKGSCLVDGAQDYLGYLNQLQDRQLRSHGEVLTFGSGDCGQLAHGTDNEEDLLVKFPRIVYSLRDKKVCMVSCGGLHNAIVTENGQVYTWGCSDDGSLGRQGDEAVPEPVVPGPLVQLRNNGQNQRVVPHSIPSMMYVAYGPSCHVWYTSRRMPRTSRKTRLARRQS